MSDLLETHVLVVDADELSIALIKSSLETQHFVVTTALDCDVALRHASKNEFSLVICDCDMRAGTGVRIEPLIQSIPGRHDVPFLFTSAHQKPDVISRRRNDRNVFFVRKPFDHEAFLKLVEYAMWMPHLIRSHIQRVHEKQGLSQLSKPSLKPAASAPAIAFPTSFVASVPI